MNDLRHDFRLAARTLRREPAFAFIAVLMLALGIGSMTAIFSVVNGVLLKPLPYPHPERLVSIREVVQEVAHIYPFLSANARHFVEWRKQCRSFEHLAVANAATMNLTGSGEPERLDGAIVSPNLFRMLGVRPAIGRDFLDEEEQEGRDRVSILTDGLWRRRFHADPSIVGKTITLNGRTNTVIGILPASFRLTTRNTFGIAETTDPPAEIFRPAVFTKEELAELLGMHNWNVLGRLKPGATREQALHELEAVQQQMIRLAGEKQGLHADIRPMLDLVVGNAGPALMVLLGAVGVVLLIVCVNLANLFLALGERRARDAAVRTALGATRAQLMRQTMVEAFLTALAGGALGVLVAVYGVKLLIHAAPAGIPRLGEVAIDARVLLFGFAVTLATSVLFGLLPAWRTSRADPQEVLKAGGRTAAGSRAGMRLRNGLVTAEVTLSAALLIAAGLLMNSFLRILHADKGFNAPTVLAVDLGLSPAKYNKDQRNDFYKRLTDELAAQPGVLAAGIATALPLQGETWIDSVWTPGQEKETESSVNIRFISSDYLRTMGIPLRAGRTFSDNDRGRKVAIISEKLAARLFPGRDPVGRTITRGHGQNFEVIGVAGDVRVEAHRQPVAMMYWPYWDWAPARVVLVARAQGDPRSIAGTLRSAIRSLGPDVPVPQMRTMSQLLDKAVATRRYNMLLAISFAAVALLLASLGIYGVISYAVARRTGEMGVRAALGARPARLYALILRQGMAPVIAGLVLGVAAALALGRLLANMLYEVNARDPLTILAVAALVASVAVIACYIPARRAARTDPATALRYE
jgi:putative ABC transport system permease protein